MRVFPKYPRTVFCITLNSLPLWPCPLKWPRGLSRPLSWPPTAPALFSLDLGSNRVLLASFLCLQFLNTSNLGISPFLKVPSPLPAPPLGFSSTYGNPGIRGLPSYPSFLSPPFAYSYGVLDRFPHYAAPTSTILPLFHTSTGVISRL